VQPQPPVDEPACLSEAGALNTDNCFSIAGLGHSGQVIFSAREREGFETMIAAAPVVFMDRQEIAAINA
jgi:hypothetical protein